MPGSATMDATRLPVPMAEFRLSAERGTRLATVGLGSCIAVCLFDGERRVAGMLHAMLPLSQADPAAAKEQPAMYADTGIIQLRQAMLEAGARGDALEAWLVGGAQVLAASEAGPFRVGQRNAAVARVMCAEMGITLAGEATGGRFARSVEFDPATKVLVIRTAGEEQTVRWEDHVEE
ncbi:MAG: chemotaxis protein CheD [Candidatus Hydrogenedens sp.]|nr:chemotaxis protein CheD [Candidatus Hydrogenedens sp.]